MGTVNNFFFDTYALFEIVHENKDYSYYLNVGVITTKLNLMELHYRLLFLYGKKIAETAFSRFLPFVIDISDEIIKESNFFKLFNKNKNLSYIDCLGYTISKAMNIKFLTGDKEFNGLDNVEFVK